MKQDELTQQYVKQWGVKEVPTAEVAHGAIAPGSYPAFALLAWVEQRRANWPVVGLRLTLLTPEQDRAIGGLTMGLPLTPKSERHVCCFLEDLGWDGRVWPYKDLGWPSGTLEEEGLIGLLRAAKLGATLTFPSDPEKGTRTVLIPVQTRKGSYSVAPFGDVIIPKYLETLRTLAANPTPFVSDWGKS